MGIHVCYGLFSVFAYATYEKCDTVHIFCKCDISRVAACFLFNRKITSMAAASGVSSTYNSCFPDVTIYYGAPDSKRMVNCPWAVSAGGVFNRLCGFGEDKGNLA